MAQAETQVPVAVDFSDLLRGICECNQVCIHAQSLNAAPDQNGISPVGQIWAGLPAVGRQHECAVRPGKIIEEDGMFPTIQTEAPTVRHPMRIQVMVKVRLRHAWLQTGNDLNGVGHIERAFVAVH